MGLNQTISTATKPRHQGGKNVLILDIDIIFGEKSKILVGNVSNHRLEGSRY